MNNEKDNGIFFSTQEILTEEIILYVHIVNKVTVKNSVITDLDLREICSRTTQKQVSVEKRVGILKQYV